VRANKSLDYEVTLLVSDKIIDACPDKEWRLIFSLARYGGLRVPSELFALRWADIDWTSSKVRIDSPKTGERFMPLFSELRPYLEDAFDPESEFVISANRSKPNLRTQLMRIIKKAGLQPWPKLFQNLRASRSSELAKEYGPHVEAEWLGHSVEVAGEHYVRASRADYEKAAGEGEGVPDVSAPVGVPKTAQKTAQHGANPARTEPHCECGASKNPEESKIPRGWRKASAPPVGLEPTTKRLTAACSTN
jgi:hypothetical protein